MGEESTAVSVEKSEDHVNGKRKVEESSLKWLSSSLLGKKLFRADVPSQSTTEKLASSSQDLEPKMKDSGDKQVAKCVRFNEPDKEEQGIGINNKCSVNGRQFAPKTGLRLFTNQDQFKEPLPSEQDNRDEVNIELDAGQRDELVAQTLQEFHQTMEEFICCVEQGCEALKEINDKLNSVGESASQTHERMRATFLY